MNRLALIVLVSMSIGATAANGADLSEPPWPSSGTFPAYPATREYGWRFRAVAAAVEDDNLFRVDQRLAPQGSTQAEDTSGDRYAVLGAGIDAQLGHDRQRLRIDAQADRYSFELNSNLDRYLYRGEFDWHWAIGNRLRGSVGFAQRRMFPDFSELQYASEDAITHRFARLGADWRPLTRLSLRVQFDGERHDHDDATRGYLNNRVGAGTVGVFFTGAASGAAGFQYRAVEAVYPHREQVGATFVDNRYRENEASLVLEYPLESKIGLRARLGFTERLHRQVVERDFEGGTGRLELRFVPAPKVVFDAIALRELQAVEELSASYAVVDGGSLGLSWAPTLKWVIQTAYTVTERSLRGDPGFVLSDSPPRTDRTRAARIALGYEPNRRIGALVSYERGARRSNAEGADYRYNRGWFRLTFSL